MRVFLPDINLHMLFPYYPFFTNLDHWASSLSWNAIQMIQTQNASNYSIQFHIKAVAVRKIVEE
jgi:hypothetical protein